MSTGTIYDTTKHAFEGLPITSSICRYCERWFTDPIYHSWEGIQMIVASIEAQPRSVAQIEEEIACINARIGAINQEMSYLRAERDSLNKLREVSREELFGALGREVRKESQS